jgi:magnesium chelatase family protein
MRGGAVAARRAHNPKVAGSNPAPAIKTGTHKCLFSFNLCEIRNRTCDPNVTSLTSWMILSMNYFRVLSFLVNHQSIAAMYSCPCGFYGDSMKPCTCASALVTKYQKQISGRLLDRIDIHIEVPRVDYDKLSGDRVGETSATIRARVQAVRDIQNKRFSKNNSSDIICNADMCVGELGNFASCRLKVRV